MALAADLLSCPKCHSKLDGLFCNYCRREFKKQGNVYYFSVVDDVFYEGKFVENKDAKAMLPEFLPESLRLLLWKFFVKCSVVLKYQKFFYRHLRNQKKYNSEKLKILDLACGGGNNFLLEFGEVYGLDISKSSIDVAKKFYDFCFVGDIFHLPFSDQSFDVIVSFELIEHVPEDKIDDFFIEIKRVMKFDGLSLHYFVVDSECALGRFIKKYPELYKKYFVEMDGHDGLRTTSQNLRVLSRHFNVIEYKSLLMPLGMSKYFDNEYSSKNILVSLISKFSKIIVGNKYLHSLMVVILNPIYFILNNFKSDDEGFNMLVALKNNNPSSNNNVGPKNLP